MKNQNVINLSDFIIQPKVRKLMTETYERTFKMITEQKNKDRQLYKFFESLLYGTWGKQNSKEQNLRNYNVYSQQASQCVVYLHENHIELLVCIDKWMPGYRSYFNIKNIQILELHSTYEMNSNLERDKYLILKEKHQQTVLLFDDSEKKNLFKKNLQKLRTIMKKIPDLYDPIVLKSFIRADTNQNDEISWEELKSLVRMMKIDLNISLKQNIKRMLKKDPIQRIYFSDFQKMWKILYCRPQLIGLFQKYDNEKFATDQDFLQPKLDIEEFKKFLINQQKQTKEESERIISELYKKDSVSLSFYDFCHYIYGPANNLINEYKNEQIKYTSKPLNHYYCYSSHNTYLTGDQLFSSSRAERYLIDLQDGLRCVEIDAHDGPDCPIVKHGYTPTPSVNFEDVIKAVKRFTDLDPNHTPIILSIENHCNQKNQIQMSKILQDNFTEKILKVNADLPHFPTLKECIGKIIIKGPGNFKLFVQNKKKTEDVLQDSFSEEQELQQQTNKELQNEWDSDKFSPSYNFSRQSFNEKMRKLQNEKRQFLQKKKEFQQLKIQPNYLSNILQGSQKSLVKTICKTNSNNYHEKYKVSGKFLQIICMLSKSKLENKQQSHWESISFSQEKINKFFEDQQKITQMRQLSNLKWFRSYPAGLRIWSSNYDPLPALQLGTQIVAINTQTQDDVNSHILKAFFMKGLNKTCGYRLKPSLQDKVQGQSTQKIPTQNHAVHTLTTVTITFKSGLRIYQNEDDFKSIPPVCIKAYFTGTKRDNYVNEHLLTEKQYTEVVEKDAFRPKFTKSVPLQIKCQDPELGFLVVQVPDCGRAVIPVDSMKHGWRVFSLYDHELKEKQSKILCYIQLKKYPN